MNTTSRSRTLTADEYQAFGDELDALRARTVASLGASDARYIRRVAAAVRYGAIAGRVLIMAGAVGGAFFAPMFWPALVAGTLALAFAKILENMELGHNVIHGQYDWMRDPHLDGATYEWDIVATSANWRKTHNYQHHTWTNVRGLDDDVGYGLLRLFPEQRWKPFYLMQPLIAIVFAIGFEWGVALQDLKLGNWFARKVSTRRMLRQFRPIGIKMARQVGKDYVLFPLLAGPYFLPVLLANAAANVLRNLWTYTIIFCGHFTADAETFPKQWVKGETRGQWYVRQLRGSSNLRGGRLINLMSGNLSHQIEHHFFPDVPANRYAAMAVTVREICARYGQHYNTGTLPNQFGQVIWRILRHAWPSRPRAAKPPRVGVALSTIASTLTGRDGA